MGLSRYEKETVINFNDEEAVVYLSTAQDWMKRKIRLLAELHPDEVVIVSEDQYTLKAELPKKYIHVRPPKKLSDEQRQAAAERLKQFRLRKKQNS